jgi:uncharacterized protein YndB with AHSA1/START domain
MSDRIEKTIELKAPVSRVWRALIIASSARGSAFGWTRHSCQGRFRVVR